MARDLATGASSPPIPAIFTAGEFGDVGADLWKRFGRRASLPSHDLGDARRQMYPNARVMIMRNLGLAADMDRQSNERLLGGLKCALDRPSPLPPL